MDWKGSIQKMISFLKEAQKGEKEDLSFKIAFGESPSESESEQGQIVVTDDGADDGNETESARVISFGKLSKSLFEGCHMYILAAIETTYFAQEYLFELIEQERKDLDIMTDITDDIEELLKREIGDLKKKLADVGTGTIMASWYASNAFSGSYATLNGVHVAPTRDGMCHLSDNKQQINIDMAGVYKIEAMVNFNGYTGGNHQLDIYKNGSVICRKYNSTSGGFGAIHIYVDLNQNDYIQFYSSSMSGTGKQYNSFTIIKM